MNNALLMENIDTTQITQITLSSPTEISIPQPQPDPIVISLDKLNSQMSQLVMVKTMAQSEVDKATDKITNLQTIIDAAIAAGAQTQAQIDASNALQATSTQ